MSEVEALRSTGWAEPPAEGEKGSGRNTAPAPAALEVAGVALRFGGVQALDNVSFAVADNAICGLIGPNGAGKTSLFNVVTRLYQPDSGRVTAGGTDLLALPVHALSHHGVSRTFQNLALYPSLTVVENVMSGIAAVGGASWLRALLYGPRSRRERELRQRAETALERLGLEALATRPARGLPFGTLKRIELARAVAADPRLLLLDEPANGLTHSEVDELADVIRGLRDSSGITILLVEHHMGLVSKLCQRVVVLDFGRKIAEGTPAEIVNDEAVIQAYLGGRRAG